jgi:hypothetical protein
MDGVEEKGERDSFNNFRARQRVSESKRKRMRITIIKLKLNAPSIKLEGETRIERER